MFEEEKILKQEAGVKAYNSDSPPTMGLRAGAFAEVGTLILTNRRLVYVSKGGTSRAATYVLGGALAARAVEKSVSKAEIDDLVKYEGSYCIPIEDINRVETARKMGSGYLRVDSPSFGQKPSHSFIFGSGWSKNEEWVKAINSAIAAKRTTQAATATTFPAGQKQEEKRSEIVCPSCRVALSSQATFCTSCGTSFITPNATIAAPPPPPLPPSAPTCPACGAPIRYIQQYQRWYCDKERKYL